jgi:dTDP-4-amino-4,6-dideoxygalactose transaminase
MPDVLSITHVRLGADEERSVLDVLRSGQLAQGPKVEELEHRFAKLTQVAHTVAVANGTVALIAALQALELDAGFEVVTSPFTFIATVSAIVAAGGTVRFADVGPDFNLDPGRVEEALTPGCAVLLPVHLYGLPANLDALVPIAERAGLRLVEDAAQAHGATVDGRPVGSFGIGCFSLYATKNLTAGEGGLVTTDSDAVAERLRLLRNHGMRNRYEYEVLGYNYRMTDVQAAIVLPQLDRFDDMVRTRRRNAAILSDGLAGIEGLTVPVVPARRSHVWHQYTVRVGPAARLGRDELAAQLGARGIETRVYYPKPVYRYAWCQRHPAVRSDPTPVAEAMAREVLSLPVHAGLTDSDAGRIVDEVRELLT